MSESTGNVITLVFVFIIMVLVGLYGKLVIYIPLFLMFFIAVCMPVVMAFKDGNMIAAALLTIPPLTLIYWFFIKK